MLKPSEYRRSYISDICSNLKKSAIETIRVLTNGHVSNCLFPLARDILRIIKYLILSVCSQPRRQWKKGF